MRKFSSEEHHSRDLTLADSLRDQLVKAGLATSTQAKKAEKQARAENHARRQGKGGKSGKGKATREGAQDPNAPEAVRARAAKQQAEKKARDRALAQTTNEKAAAKALRAEMRQLILRNDQRAKEANEDDVPYNFVHNTKIKKIYVPKAQLEQLSKGSLVIVNNDGLYHLVSREVAERIRARDPKRIIAAHEDKAPEPGSDDEFYAKFEVPDDLDW
jgi:uncharacterized protein YaiL (DUF2058 family)